MGINLTTQQKEHLKKLLQHAEIEATRILERYRSQKSSGELERLAATTIEALARWLKAVEEGEIQIERRPVAVGMGISRGLSEWCEDDALLNAVFSAEDYFLALQES